MASERSFREIIGVELNPKLVDTAKLNIRRWVSSGRAVCPVKVLCCDETEFPLPEGPCLVFIYNSFGEPVVRQVAAALGDKVRQGKGPVDIIYQNAEWVTTILQESAFQELWRERLPMTPEDAAADPVSTPEDLTIGLRASSSL
jgi:hypothetical protein